MEQTVIKGRVNAKTLGLDDIELMQDQMVERLRRMRSAITVRDVKRMFVNREEDELFFTIGYYFLTPAERRDANVRLNAVFRGYLALRYLDCEIHAEDGESPFERYSRADVSTDVDEFCRLFRAAMRFRICHKCHESKPLREFRLGASTVCNSCQNK